MAPQDMAFFNDMKALAKDKIRCECDNAEWEQFLYVGAGNHTVAGCKKCGRSYTYDVESSAWKNVSGPGPWHKGK